VPTDTMYDSTNALGIPESSGAAKAGYVNGSWPSFAAIVKRFPLDPHVSITVTSQGTADFLDVELGDAPQLDGGRDPQELIQSLVGPLPGGRTHLRAVDLSSQVSGRRHPVEPYEGL
jgi:hypothetical protein